MQVWRGRRWVAETDAAECFTAIPHDELMRELQTGVVDQPGLKLLRLMLGAGVMADGSVRKAVTGTPQSGVVTPPTQQRTFVHGTLRVGCAVVAAAAGVLADRDVVAEFLWSDEDVLDDGAQDVL
jgi:hypothetical protein